MNIWSSFRKKAQKMPKVKCPFFRQGYGYAMKLKYHICTAKYKGNMYLSVHFPTHVSTCLYLFWIFVNLLSIYFYYFLSRIMQIVFQNYLGNAALFSLDLIVNILMTSNTMNLSFCPYKFWYSAGNLVVPQGDFRVRWNLNITFFSFVALEVEGSLWILVYGLPLQGFEFDTFKLQLLTIYSNPWIF